MWAADHVPYLLLFPGKERELCSAQVSQSTAVPHMQCSEWAHFSSELSCSPGPWSTAGTKAVQYCSIHYWQTNSSGAKGTCVCLFLEEEEAGQELKFSRSSIFYKTNIVHLDALPLPGTIHSSFLCRQVSTKTLSNQDTLLKLMITSLAPVLSHSSYFFCNHKIL